MNASETQRIREGLINVTEENSTSFSTETMATAAKPTTTEIFDVAVIGGGPAGATAAAELAKTGLSVVLFDRANRIKPCGGAIPPVLVDEFDIPPELLVAQVHSARMISPANRKVDMPIEGGYVGMVNREEFDPWLRSRAETFGATLKHGKCLSFDRVLLV